MEPWIIVVVQKSTGQIKLVWDGDYWKRTVEWAEAYPVDEATALAWKLRAKFPDLADEIEVTTPPLKQDWSTRRPDMGAARRKEKEEPESYQFSELSEEAKDRAIEAYVETHQESLFDQHDSESLSDFMKQDLADHYHLGDGLEVGWSLGYSQGDGVCFWGLVDISQFLRAERKLKAFGEIINRATARILHEGHYCHWNSMRVEVESQGTDVRDFLPKNMVERYTEFEWASRERAQQQWAARSERERPISEWRNEVQRWEENIRKGKYRKQDWTPRGPLPPGPRPAEAEVAIPPNLEMDPALRRAYDRASAEYEHFAQVLLNQFEEYLSERIKEISKELEETGYAEIEYHRSSEYISQILEDDDTKYTVDGDLFEE